MASHFIKYLMFKVLMQVVMKLGLDFYELCFLFKNESENQQLSCISHDKPFLWYVFHRCILVGLGPSKYILVLTWSWSSISNDTPFCVSGWIREIRTVWLLSVIHQMHSTWISQAQSVFLCAICVCFVYSRNTVICAQFNLCITVIWSDFWSHKNIWREI